MCKGIPTNPSNIPHMFLSSTGWNKVWGYVLGGTPSEVILDKLKINRQRCNQWEWRNTRPNNPIVIHSVRDDCPPRIPHPQYRDLPAHWDDIDQGHDATDRPSCIRNRSRRTIESEAIIPIHWEVLQPRGQLKHHMPGLSRIVCLELPKW